MPKCVLHSIIVKFENFVQGEWREEKFLKGGMVTTRGGKKTKDGSQT